MVNIEILEGLKAGLERGQSLKRTMMSFFNAGYSKLEIEEAARALSQIPVRQEISPQPEMKNQKQKMKAQPQMSVPSKVQPQFLKQQIQKPAQNVSNYESSLPKKSDKLIVIVLVSVLVFLLGILATVFFFKDEIMSLFGGG
ncbi:MAG: hypothetical protein Q7S06_02900 [Nanoarchaeota archaeon]|nr:hypothetical protein [Nanoarchaeota archaeon]